MAYEVKNARQVRISEGTETRQRIMIVAATQHLAIPILGWAIGDSYPGDSDYRLISMGTEAFPPGGGTNTKVTATYSNKAPGSVEEPDVDPVWRYSVGTEEDITIMDLDHLQIGHSGEGVSKAFPVSTAECTVWLESPIFANFRGLVGTTNAAIFNSGAISTWLYLGFDGHRVRKAPGHDYWEIVHRFEFKSYYSDDPPAQNGWLYRWMHRRETTTEVAGVNTVTVEFFGLQNYNRLYDTGDYTLLQIPGEV